MYNIKQFFPSIAFAVAALSLNSCVQDDDYKMPPIDCLEVTKATHTLADVFALVGDGQYKFPDNQDYIVDGYVISSDETGNFYKTFSIQDKVSKPTYGVQIETEALNLYSKYPLYAKVQVNLKGLIAGMDRGVLKIGVDDPSTTYMIDRMPEEVLTKNVAKFCYQGETPVPTVYENLKDALKDEHINTLVTIKNIQFLDPKGDATYGDVTNNPPKTLNRKLVDRLGKTVDLRNSGFAKWAGNELPEGSGEITVIVSKYGTSYQLYIRDTDDVKFDQPRFGDTGGGGNEGGSSSEAANFLFAGADFEDWTTFLGSLNRFGLGKDLAVQGIGLGRDGSNAFHLNGTTLDTNPYVFTVNAGTLTIPEKTTKITLWVKGAANKSLSFNVYTTDGTIFFNAGEFGSQDISLNPAGNNQYIGAVNTNNEWRLITLNINGLTLNKTGDLFALKAGSKTKYDIIIDIIKVE